MFGAAYAPARVTADGTPSRKLDMSRQADRGAGPLRRGPSPGLSSSGGGNVSECEGILPLFMLPAKPSAAIRVPQPACSARAAANCYSLRAKHSVILPERRSFRAPCPVRRPLQSRRTAGRKKCDFPSCTPPRPSLNTAAVGASPSGKAAVFGTAIPRFESWRPSHLPESICILAITRSFPGLLLPTSRR